MRQSATPTGKHATRRRTSRLLGLALILLTLALALSAGASAFVSSGGGGWVRQSWGSGRGFYAVAFSDATHGWAVGDDRFGGAILATTDGGGAWSAQDPWSGPSEIARLKPPSGKRGALVTISGADFGPSQGAGAVKFGAKTCTKYVSWSATQIECKVPAAAKYGALKVTVTTAAGVSNARSFRVKR